MSLHCVIGCRFPTSALGQKLKLQAPTCMFSSRISDIRGKKQGMVRFFSSGGLMIDVSKVMTTGMPKGKASEVAAEVLINNGKPKEDSSDSDDDSDGDSDKTRSFGSREQSKSKVLSEGEDDTFLMTDEERWEFRRMIRDVMDKNPDVKEEMDPLARQKKMEELLADYPLVVDEEDPDWPEDADGRDFNLDQFFNKISIKNVRKDDDDNYDSEKELVWQDDDYIRAVKDITSKEWEETVFKDISPLVILVHNRYRRPKINEQVRKELEKGVQIFWDSRLPSPRCVAVDAVVDIDLVTSLNVSVFPELLFTKAGKILYREKAMRSADELSRIMAFFYYGANQPSWFVYDNSCSQELIPFLP